jgi:hypothetical protein
MRQQNIKSVLDEGAVATQTQSNIRIEKHHMWKIGFSKQNILAFTAYKTGVDEAVWLQFIQQHSQQFRI